MLMEVIKERYRDGKIPVHFLLDFLQNKFYKDSDIHQWHISEVRQPPLEFLNIPFIILTIDTNIIHVHCDRLTC